MSDQLCASCKHPIKDHTIDGCSLGCPYAPWSCSCMAPYGDSSLVDALDPHAILLAMGGSARSNYELARDADIMIRQIRRETIEACATVAEIPVLRNEPHRIARNILQLFDIETKYWPKGMEMSELPMYPNECEHRELPERCWRCLSARVKQLEDQRDEDPPWLIEMKKRTQAAEEYVWCKGCGYGDGSHHPSCSRLAPNQEDTNCDVCEECGERDCGGAPRFAGLTSDERAALREEEAARKKYFDIANRWLTWQPEEPDDLQSLTELLLRVRRETIEACARICEDAYSWPGHDVAPVAASLCCASRIRALLKGADDDR